MLEWATKYATVGWHVFPCRGKFPYAEYDQNEVCVLCRQPYNKDGIRKGHTPECITPANGFKDATNDKEKIKAWWTQWPQANIALATGIKSNILVVDIDGEAGYDSLAKLREGYVWDTPKDSKEKHWRAPQKDDPIYVLNSPMRVKTSKGEHLYYSHSDHLGNSASKLGTGIDVRGEGGYVILPPSIHPDTGRAYEWL